MIFIDTTIVFNILILPNMKKHFPRRMLQRASGGDDGEPETAQGGLSGGRGLELVFQAGKDDALLTEAQFGKAAPIL